MKAAIGQMREGYAFSERRACALVLLSAGTYRYVSRRTDEPLRSRLVELAREKPRYGSPRLHVLLQREGWEVNHKRVERVYREAGLALRRKRRKHCVRVGRPLVQRTAANQEWALDFVHDAVACGRTIRVLSVLDAYTRECLALGSEHQLRVATGDARAGCDHRRARPAAGDPLRQRAGADRIFWQRPSSGRSSCCTSSPAS